MKKDIPPIAISDEMIEKLNNAIKTSLDFEQLTKKQLNITSIVGEVLACRAHNLKLMIDDINEGFDALDKDGKRVQIKTRRFKGVLSALTGSLLDKNYDTPFDYAILVLLNEKYELLSSYTLSSDSIKQHFERINENRTTKDKQKRKTMTISQFMKLADKK
ncbi:hypothetical protein D3C71_584010 [compost metagenome]